MAERDVVVQAAGSMPDDLQMLVLVGDGSYLMMAQEIVTSVAAVPVSEISATGTRHARAAYEQAKRAQRIYL
jgi:hypothetical protein